MHNENYDKSNIVVGNNIRSEFINTNNMEFRIQPLEEVKYKLDEDSEERLGMVVYCKKTIMKVFYGVLDYYSGDVYENVDSVFVEPTTKSLVSKDYV